MPFHLNGAALEIRTDLRFDIRHIGVYLGRADRPYAGFDQGIAPGCIGIGRAERMQRCRYRRLWRMNGLDRFAGAKATDYPNQGQTEKESTG